MPPAGQSPGHVVASRDATARRIVATPRGQTQKQMRGKNLPDLLQRQDTLKGRWRILSKIGAGGFGQVYLAVDQQLSHLLAIKAEAARSKYVLKMEVAVLKQVKSAHVARYYGCGSLDGCKYMAVELLGRDLSQLRKLQLGTKFTLPTVVHLARQTLFALRDIHAAGVLHRDVKASNFVVGVTSQAWYRVYAIDFGLARFYQRSDGMHKVARRRAGFRGTSRYAAPAAHMQQDLGRKDDLYSWLYMLIEMISGSLPWRHLKDKEEVWRLKSKTTWPELLAGCPPMFHAIAQYLDTLSFQDTPDYDMLLAVLDRIFPSHSPHCTTPVLDWTYKDALTSTVASAIGGQDHSPPPTPLSSSGSGPPCLACYRTLQLKGETRGSTSLDTAADHVSDVPTLSSVMCGAESSALHQKLQPTSPRKLVSDRDQEPDDDAQLATKEHADDTQAQDQVVPSPAHSPAATSMVTSSLGHHELAPTTTATPPLQRQVLASKASSLQVPSTVHRPRPPSGAPPSFRRLSHLTWQPV
eukprot:m.363811 g.363811  ORF g.363811 m.363811 type:complete len:524 (+) comp24258_c0_seq1:213-1784(+)